MRNLAILAALLAASPASAELRCFAQDTNLVCYDVTPVIGQTTQAMMSQPATQSYDLTLDAAYADAQQPVYSAPAYADQTAMLSPDANPYEGGDTVDAFGSTNGGTCMTASLDPNQGC